MERLMDEVSMEVQAELVQERLAGNRTPDSPQQMSADVRLQAPQGNTPAAAARDSSNRSWLPGVREDTSEEPGPSPSPPTLGRRRSENSSARPQVETVETVQDALRVLSAAIAAGPVRGCSSAENCLGRAGAKLFLLGEGSLYCGVCCAQLRLEYPALSEVSLQVYQRRPAKEACEEAGGQLAEEVEEPTNSSRRQRGAGVQQWLADSNPSEAPSESIPWSLAAHLGSPDESRFVTQGGRP